MWIVLDYNAAPASYLLTLDLLLPVQKLLVIFALPSRLLAGTYVNASAKKNLLTTALQCLIMPY